MESDSNIDADAILSEVLSGDVPAEEVSGEVADGESFTVAQGLPDRERTDVIDSHIEQLATDLDVSDPAVEMAKSLRDQYRNQRGDLIGTALEFVGAACLYCSCKVNEEPLDPTDFAEADASVVSRRGLLRRSKDIAQKVGLDPSAFFGSQQYIDRYCEELGLSPEVKDRAHEIVELTEETGLASGKSPSGWAAAAVYNASLEKEGSATQSEVGEVANVSKVTIRNRYQEQRELLQNSE